MVFAVTDQLLIRCFTFDRHWRNNAVQRDSTSDIHRFREAYDIVRKEALYNILAEFGVPMKLVKLINLSLNGTYSQICTGRHLSGSGRKQGVALTALLLSFALEYAIRKVQEDPVGLKLNWTHQPLVYADDMNLLGDNVDIKKNT
jgi:hypothetical protein